MELNTQQVIDAIKSAMSNPNNELLKYFTQNATATQGIQGYNLEAPAKILYPYLVPLLDSIPRNSAGFGSQANWKAITAVNSTWISLGVA
jgi:hypothetical protein